MLEAQGRILVGSREGEPLLCFSVTPGTGEGVTKQFIDIQVSESQLKALAQEIEFFLSASQEER